MERVYTETKTSTGKSSEKSDLEQEYNGKLQSKSMKVVYYYRCR